MAMIETNVAASRADFRRRRLGEPLQRYLDAYGAVEPVLQPVMARLQKLLAGEAAALPLLRQLWQSEDGRAMVGFWGHRLDDLKEFVIGAH